jgi:prepilin-type N-terminal cleavage/methylation domain-containing protein
MTLLEVMVAVAIVGILAGVTTVRFMTWQENQVLTTTARKLADAFSLARMEAIRTGNIHIVYLAAGVGTDVAGNPLVDSNGRPVPLLILNDGQVGSPGQNCIIDAGEPTRTMPMVRGMAWGFSVSGGVKPPLDTTAPGNATGSSFATPAGNPLNGIAFGADGVPISFDLACNLGQFGSGNGGVYITNGQRDYAVVVLPLGGIRVHGWEPSAGVWKD